MVKEMVLSAVIFVSGSCMAQQPAGKNQTKAAEDAAWKRAGCGADDIHFDVKTDKHQHTLAAPEADKALVYVFEDDLTRGGVPTTRVGVDGKWIGGNVSDSYLFFSIAAGTHRLCSNWQGHPRVGAAEDFTAAAGKTYFFHAKISSFGNDTFTLEQVPEAEGHFLIASHELSTSAERHDDY